MGIGYPGWPRGTELLGTFVCGGFLFRNNWKPPWITITTRHLFTGRVVISGPQWPPMNGVTVKMEEFRYAPPPPETL